MKRHLSAILKNKSQHPTVSVIDAGDPSGQTAPEREATIIGWGATIEGGETSQGLLEISVPIVSNANDVYRPLGSSITENMIAAGVPEGGKDACQGDSGGPFVVQSPAGNWILAGVTNWGIGCARPGLPGIYTRLSRYNDWLDRYLN